MMTQELDEGSPMITAEYLTSPENLSKDIEILSENVQAFLTKNFRDLMTLKQFVKAFRHDHNMRASQKAFVLAN